MTAGVRQIVRFNWPFYAGSAVIVSVAAWVIAAPEPAAGLRVLVFCAATPALVWTVGSLGASWFVYDHSPLTRWAWLPRVLGFQPSSWINIHAGLDESTTVLRRLFDSEGRVFDIFDPVEMREASIERARRLTQPAVAAEAVEFRSLPAGTGSTDAVLLLFSAHELRTRAARRALFREVHRILRADGRTVVVEHLRDRANFAAFGPGFLHFHSRRTWLRCFAETGFIVDAEQAMTPFVCVFVLRRAI